MHAKLVGSFCGAVRDRWMRCGVGVASLGVACRFLGALPITLSVANVYAAFGLHSAAIRLEWTTPIDHCMSPQQRPVRSN